MDSNKQRKKPTNSELNLSALEQLWLQTNSLSTTLTFLQTGAHPDDETTRALSYLSRKMGARVAYFCAVRGEGGQNSIGKEKGTAIGLLRSREMEQAARHVPMELYWSNTEFDTSIRDFGFSKNPEDTFQNWDKEKLLESLVRVIRELKPNVISPTMLDIEGQHGQHRAVTQATIEAYSLAADSTAFPEHFKQGLSVWQANQLLLPAWSASGSTYDEAVPPPKAHFELATDIVLPIWQQNSYQLAEESRQYHQSQQMGFQVDSQFGVKTPFHVLKEHYENPLPVLGAGVPLSLNDWAKSLNMDINLQSCVNIIQQMQSSFPEHLKLKEQALKALHCLRNVDAKTNVYLEAHLAFKEVQLLKLIADISGLFVEAKLVSNSLYCRESSSLTVLFNNTQNSAFDNIQVHLYDQWNKPLTKVKLNHLGAFEEAQKNMHFTVPSREFYPLQRYVSLQNANNALRAELIYQVDGIDIKQNISIPPVIIKPEVDVSFTLSARYLNLKKERSFETEVKVSGNRKGHVAVSLQVPKGWTVTPSSAELNLHKHEQTVMFKVSAPNDVNLNAYTLSANVKQGEKQWNSKFQCIDYQHIYATGYTVKAEQKIQVVDCVVPNKSVACLTGATDDYLLQLKSLGITLDVINELTSNVLKSYDTLLVGSLGFASVQETEALKPWILQGGRMVSLYHRPHDNWNPPSHLVIGSPSFRWRVTQEDSPVNYLVPDSPLLNLPNVLDEKTWQGWHKDRGLYFAKEWGNDYNPLLEVIDAEGIRYNGSLLYGKIGNGEHIHCSLLLGYQLERVVSGAASFIANLLTYKI
jgi:LmbE family N-acetylglucosaminyl deacetylase